MPREGDVPTLLKGISQRYKAALLDVIRWPWNYDRGLMDGGTSKSQDKPPPQRQILSPSFAELWRRAEFKEMHAFGIKDANGRITWSVRFKRKERERGDYAYKAYVFETPSDDETHFQNTLADLAQGETS